MHHIDVDLVFMVLEGQLPPSVLLRAAYEHLKELCPQCAESLSLVRKAEAQLFSDLEDPAEAALAARRFEPRYAAAFDAAAERARERALLVEEERKRARQDLRRLLELPAAQREEKVINARTRFRSRALAELLLEESRQLARLDPAEAGNLAALARHVVLWTPGALSQPWAETIQARSLVLRANAARVGGDLKAADGLFAEVRRFLARNALGDCELHAEVCSLEASLRFDERRLEDAESLLDRAVLLFRQAGNTEGVARTLIQRSGVQGELGNIDASMGSLRETLKLVTPQTDRHLYLCAISNLALCLCETGEYAEARRLVRDNARHYGGSDDPWTRWRRSWLDGRISLGLGELAAAESALAEARNGFIGNGNGYNAALVSLDLAMLYVQQGRSSDLRQLARMMGPIFDSQDVHREAAAALILFQQAAAAEQVTVESLARLSAYLHRARGNPKLKYERPS